MSTKRKGDSTRAKRRGRGEGSIFKRKDGTWQGAVTIGYTDEGKQKRKTVYGKTQAEARAKLDEIKQQVISGTFTDTKLIVKAYLEHWLKEKERQVKPTTMEKKYKFCVNKHIVPRIGRIRLDKLTPLHIQTMVGEIAETSGVPTANNCRRVLFSALKQAVRWQLAKSNPVEAVEPLAETPRKMTLWTPEQAARFLNVVRAHRLYALFYLDMATGMRRGELLGLRWQDVTDSTVHVRQSLVYICGEFVVSTPKTRKGERRIAISPDVVDVLEQHRLRQEAERQVLSEAWPNTDLVFTSEVGTPIHPDNLTHLRGRLMDSAGVPRVRLHDLRHLHASMAIRNGMDPKVLADRLGHSRASFTLDKYTHLFEEQRASSAVSLLDFLPKNSPDSVN